LICWPICLAFYMIVFLTLKPVLYGIVRNIETCCLPMCTYLIIFTPPNYLWYVNHCTLDHDHPAVFTEVLWYWAFKINIYTNLVKLTCVILKKTYLQFPSFLVWKDHNTCSNTLFISVQCTCIYPCLLSKLKMKRSN